ncbi:MAG: hypothetical protein RIT27_353 [Pseudomonadota bacterium]|jgi:CRISPR-associated protein (TIGR03986 family)
MSEFYLPYQFVPATAEVKETTPFEKVKKGETNARHDMWLPNKLSGRIVCRLTLETPTFVGAKQTRENENKAAFVEPYLRNGKRAIPANSLRGMISSIAETISQSSLRVLNEHDYSVRKPLDLEHTLSAVGLLKTNEKSGKLELIPLTLPSLSIKDQKILIPEKWFKIFKDRPLAECFSAYINNYQMPNNFITKNKFNCYAEADSSEKQLFWIETKLTGNLEKQTLNLNDYNDSLYAKKDKVILGQNKPQNDPKELSSNEQVNTENNKITGVLRILGVDGRKEQLPPTKKHELFIPYDPKKEYTTLAIEPQALENFHTLAKERLEESKKNRSLSRGIKLPFLPKGYEQYYQEFYNEKDKDRYARLQTGMLVFFDINNQQIVTELSLSANWRKEVGKNRDYFKKISKNLLPFNPERNDLTPAELLFGFIEEGKQKGAKSSRALASRIRFSDGLSINKPEENDKVVLKVLGSPKPPCPSLYFGRGQHLKKIELNPEKVTPERERYHPNGRKYYLHHPQKQINAKFWKAESSEDDDLINMRLECSPIAQKEEFWFHIDFENLSDSELTLLLKSLHPSDDFRHKLGLGKSLGLGSVKIDMMGVFGIDRATRYSSNALKEKTRYHWGYEIKQDDIKQNDFYESECQAHNLENLCFSYDESLIDKKALSILNKIGDRSAILDSEHWVHNPLTTNQKPTKDQQVRRTEQHKFESETFKWFGENDRLQSGQQALGRIKENEPLPTLKTIDEH